MKFKSDRTLSYKKFEVMFDQYNTICLKYTFSKNKNYCQRNIDGIDCGNIDLVLEEEVGVNKKHELTFDFDKMIVHVVY